MYEYLCSYTKQNTTLFKSSCIKVVSWWAEVDSKHFRLLQPFILKGFRTVPQLCPKQFFAKFIHLFTRRFTTCCAYIFSRNNVKVIKLNKKDTPIKDKATTNCSRFIFLSNLPSSIPISLLNDIMFLHLLY